VVLITNPSLKLTDGHGNDVDLELSFVDSEPFWFWFWFESFSVCFHRLIRWFTTMNARCKLWNFEGFLKNVRVYDSEPKLLESVLIYIVSGFVVVLESKQRGELAILPGFISEI